MVFFTGDIHGTPWKIIKFVDKMHLTGKDTIVILGDVGANYFMDERDAAMKTLLNKLGVDILCIHGNHEIRPANIPSYKLQTWKRGKVWCEDAYPRLKFAKDGEIYHIEGRRYIAIGGAYSVDKYYRLARGLGWWDDEQPSDDIKAYVEKKLSRGIFDTILSHTCPYKYEPTDMFLSGVDQSKVDKSTEEWLDKIEEKYYYKNWLCGHWHTDRQINKLHFLFNTWESSENLL
ncbi:MAG: metallophosphoesterase [Ruminococcaceae bacterium]|nr:metallophosphoesterase [Oscillospiraceae bacterium]